MFAPAINRFRLFARLPAQSVAVRPRNAAQARRFSPGKSGIVAGALRRPSLVCHWTVAQDRHLTCHWELESSSGVASAPDIDQLWQRAKAWLLRPADFVLMGA